MRIAYKYLGLNSLLSKCFLNRARVLKSVFRRAIALQRHTVASAESGGGRHFGQDGVDVELAIAALLAVLVVFPVFFFLYDLGAYPLRDNNEGLYAEIALEMLESANFIVPHLLGVPYIEKPPLLYWLMALSFRVFGPSESSARLVSALPMSCLATALFVFCHKRRHHRAGFHAALVMSTALPVAVLSRTVLFDPLLTALLAGSFLAFLQWYFVRRQSWIRLAAALLALATLDKGGLAPVLSAGVIGTFVFLHRDFRVLKSVVDPIAIGLFFAVAAPWHIFAALQQENFAWFYFVNEHLLRFIGMREPNDYHSGPPYYYLPRVLLLLLPWTPFLWLLLRPLGGQDPAQKALLRFCQAWVLFPLLFFSLAQAKGTYYIMVVAPACALWLGIVLAYRLEAGDDRLLSYCLGSAMTICAAGLWALLFMDRLPWRSCTGILVLIPGAIGCAAAWKGGSRLFSIFRRKGWMCDAALVILGVATMPLLIVVLQIAESKSVRTSSRQVAELINRHGNVHPLVFVYRDFEDVFSSLPFYLRHRVKVIDSESRDLQFGCRVSPIFDNACVSLVEFNGYRARFPVAVAVRQAHVGSFRRLIGHGPWHTEMTGDKLVFFNY